MKTGQRLFQDRAAVVPRPGSGFSKDAVVVPRASSASLKGEPWLFKDRAVEIFHNSGAPFHGGAGTGNTHKCCMTLKCENIANVPFGRQLKTG